MRCVSVDSSPQYERLMREVTREALLEPKAADWCHGQSCNERPLYGSVLFTEFFGENPVKGRVHTTVGNQLMLNTVALLYITRPETQVTAEQPNRHYFVDIHGTVLLQTVPMPFGLRQLRDTEIDDLADEITQL